MQNYINLYIFLHIKHIYRVEKEAMACTHSSLCLALVVAIYRGKFSEQFGSSVVVSQFNHLLTAHKVRDQTDN